MRHVDFEQDHTADLNRVGGPVVIVTARRHQEIETALHSHSRGQLMIATQGLITVGVESGVWIVPAAHSVWMPPHRLHSMRSHGPFERSGVYIDEFACATLSGYPTVIRTTALLNEAVLRAAEWSDCDDPLDAQNMRVVAVLIDEIRRLPVETFVLPVPRDERLQRVARALIDNPADERDLESWARLAKTSSRTLSRRFADDTGFNFTDWRQRARLLRSLELLTTDLPISVIALDLGYATASAYISVFRRTFGQTPAHYRRHCV
jgi:AraC-like DNA-binding protein